jgi:hypothetical protein
MKKNLLFLIVAAGFFTSCDVRKKDQQATVAPSDSAQLKKSVENPTTVQLIDSVYDFGKVMDGEIVEYSYRFKNTGKNPLVISHVSASCGCTVPEKPDQPILPGEIGYIKVKFNSENRQGEAHKTVFVQSNAVPAFPELLLKGQVEPKK